ncbi:hypothetical protein PIB30_090291, partial [Stylosanthes scabra]|nr:hypothetical protein [Stylosanthes scabra]
CGRTVNRNAALTLHPRGRTVGLCGRAVIGRMHPKTLPRHVRSHKGTVRPHGAL